jgi:acyl-coenzyme A synthetase/AMP-(fatty) acid ligase/SAM-dependent methyltransferase/acyl carrier protein
VIPHRAVVRLLFATDYIQPRPSDRIAHLSTTAFDAATFEIWGALLHGARLVVVPKQTALSAPALAALIRREGITTAFLTTALFNQLIDEQPALFGDLDTLLVGGEAADPGAFAAALAQAPPRRLLHAYGPTECTTFATWFHVRAAGSGGPPIGRPLANTSAHLLDRYGRPVTAGGLGEVHLGGDGLAIGYVGQPAATAERFVPNPYSARPGRRLYRTGDRARRLADGNLEFAGRLDRQVKIRGFRIEPGEIEVHLLSHPRVREATVTVDHGRQQQSRLIAYLVVGGEASGAASGDISGHVSDRVSDWERVFDEQVYAAGDAPNGRLSEAAADPLFDTTGWLSSYDGTAIPAEDMRCWAAEIVAEALAHRPRRILEIGCGSGMHLFRLATSCQAYYGTDISRSSLAHVERQIAKHRPIYDHVTVARAEATDLSLAPAGSMDLVLISSVAQYFPSFDYLSAVLSAAFERLASDGVLVLADLRDHRLQRAFYTSVELRRAAPDTPASELVRRVEERLARETELLIDPFLFPEWVRRQDAEARVRLSLQGGTHRNELNTFRYTAVIERGASPSRSRRPVSLPGDELLTQRGAMDTARLEYWLRSFPEHAVCISAVPNARTAGIVAADQQLFSATARTAGELRAEMEATHGVEPQLLLDLAARLGFAATNCASLSGGPGTFDALFAADASQLADALAAHLDHRPSQRPALANFVNRPASAEPDPFLAELRRYLAQGLPPYMLPDAFVLLDRMPLTANGKIDRRQLPAPARLHGVDAASHQPPASDVERALARTWGELLGIEQVGADASFFELGGHSLLAARLVSRIRTEFGIELPLAALFAQPTVRGLARELAAREPSPGQALAAAQLQLRIADLPAHEVERVLATLRPTEDLSVS